MLKRRQAMNKPAFLTAFSELDDIIKKEGHQWCFRLKSKGMCNYKDKCVFFPCNARARPDVGD